MTISNFRSESELGREGVGGDTLLGKLAALAVPLRYRNEPVVRRALVGKERNLLTVLQPEVNMQYSEA